MSHRRRSSATAADGDMVRGCTYPQTVGFLWTPDAEVSCVNSRPSEAASGAKKARRDTMSVNRFALHPAPLFIVMLLFILGCIIALPCTASPELGSIRTPSHRASISTSVSVSRTRRYASTARMQMAHLGQFMSPCRAVLRGRSKPPWGAPRRNILRAKLMAPRRKVRHRKKNGPRRHVHRSEHHHHPTTIDRKSGKAPSHIRHIGSGLGPDCCDTGLLSHCNSCFGPPIRSRSPFSLRLIETLGTNTRRPRRQSAGAPSTMTPGPPFHFTPQHEPYNGPASAQHEADNDINHFLTPFAFRPDVSEAPAGISSPLSRIANTLAIGTFSG